MSMLIVGSNAQHYNVDKDATVSDVLNGLKDLGELPEHNRPLTLKADGVVLSTRARIPKDALTLEVVEQHDPSVVNASDNDVIAELPSLDRKDDA